MNEREVIAAELELLGIGNPTLVDAGFQFLGSPVRRALIADQRV